MATNTEIKDYIKRLVSDITDIALALSMPDPVVPKEAINEESNAISTNSQDSTRTGLTEDTAESGSDIQS
jgi:hypothetical protein